MSKTAKSKAKAKTAAKTEAKVTGGSIVMSFKGAKNPTVWRAKISKITDLTVKLNNPKKGVYTLNAASLGEGDEVIAAFSSKAAGEEALGVVTDTLFSLEDAPTPAASDTAPPAKPTRFGFWSGVYMTAFLLISGLLIAISLHGGGPNSSIPSPLAILTGEVPANLAAARQMMPERPNTQTMGGSIDQLPDLNAGQPIDADMLRSTLPPMPNSQTMGGSIEDMPDTQQGRPLSADDFFEGR